LDIPQSPLKGFPCAAALDFPIRLAALNSRLSGRSAADDANILRRKHHCHRLAALKQALPLWIDHTGPQQDPVDINLVLDRRALEGGRHDPAFQAIPESG
jgi:hypothetical protein